MGKSVGWKSPEVSRHVLKVSPKSNEHFKAYDMGAELCRDMRTTKKPIKNRKLRGLNCVGSSEIVVIKFGRFRCIVGYISLNTGKTI